MALRGNLVDPGEARRRQAAVGRQVRRQAVAGRSRARLVTASQQTSQPDLGARTAKAAASRTPGQAKAASSEHVWHELHPAQVHAVVGAALQDHPPVGQRRPTSRVMNQPSTKRSAVPSGSPR
jgi:hypothetical protein